ncbi:MAG TPA: hypothetical protein VGB09_11755 [Candidatus Binatia bacterium]
MSDWISDVLIFSAGIAGGILVCNIVPSFGVGKRRRTELVNARERMLADIKEHHDKEILLEAFRTTEDIRDELDKSLQALRKTLTVLDPVAEPTDTPRPGVVQLSEPIEPN